MTVKEIVAEYLKANGYDGLFCDEADVCGCGLDDLAPCGQMTEMCVAAYKIVKKCAPKNCTGYVNCEGREPGNTCVLYGPKQEASRDD